LPNHVLLWRDVRLRFVSFFLRKQRVITTSHIKTTFNPRVNRYHTSRPLTLINRWIQCVPFSILADRCCRRIIGDWFKNSWLGCAHVWWRRRGRDQKVKAGESICRRHSQTFSRAWYFKAWYEGEFALISQIASFFSKTLMAGIAQYYTLNSTATDNVTELKSNAVRHK